MSALDKPLVSIITPCYNGERYLDRYFASILHQTYPNLELIFINDGSTDWTEEIAQGYRLPLEARGIRYTYLSQENAGQAAALNRGLKLFTGEYLTWPDADDEMTPDCIEKKVAYLQEHPELDMCICKVAQVREGTLNEVVALFERSVSQEDDNLFEDLLFLRNVFYTPGGYMVKASAVDEAIPGREIYPGRGGQNPQILLPIAYRKQYGYLDEVLFKYVIREESHSHSIDSSEKIIQQLFDFESILLETLKRMPTEVLLKYKSEIRNHYARLRFGNALDTRNPKLVYKYLKELTSLGIAAFSDWMRYMKCAILYKL